jgi:hypothetical protein
MDGWVELIEWLRSGRLAIFTDTGTNWGSAAFIIASLTTNLLAWNTYYFITYSRFKPLFWSVGFSLMLYLWLMKLNGSKFLLTSLENCLVELKYFWNRGKPDFVTPFTNWPWARLCLATSGLILMFFGTFDS